jgi:hypothetical protein
MNKQFPKQRVVKSDDQLSGHTNRGRTQIARGTNDEIQDFIRFRWIGIQIEMNDLLPPRYVNLVRNTDNFERFFARDSCLVRVDF